MFAGIVESSSVVVGRSPSAAGARLEVDLGPLADGLAPGASVAVNGVCLTVAAQRGTIAAFDVVPETLRLTNLGQARVGDPVNLERSLRVGDRIDGHFVQGHVDGVGFVRQIDQVSGEYLLWVEAPAELLPCIVRKGSITLDGVSLTIVAVQPPRFSVALIPTTRQRTTLGRRRIGDTLNIETDIVARIIVDRLSAMTAPHSSGRVGHAAETGVSWDALRESGFLA